MMQQEIDPRTALPFPEAIARVEEAARAGSGVRVADLARATGVSVRTVYRTSARHLGGPPMKRIRLSRLQRVRHRLLAATPGESVTSAATEAGFFHLGRFSALYRQHFGESPSATLRRACGIGRAGLESSGRVKRDAASKTSPVALRA